ncbi:FadR/GntR family transcriptional regulator [Gracilibacillus massiliensis]|uniref:FadR/GntR family transcriptional regulator n=1 Tax=Gracilibacillus massiliensis TaxID=1564956 RepID=UPI00071E1695|nr:FadR/GntR family transcriptional regulator [Gracilibacillus massiliensis]
MSFETVTVEKISQTIVTQIRKRLVDGELKPGESLPSELKLAEMFGVSRSSVRDAMQILESTGYINRRKKGGTTIRKVTFEDIANIYIPKAEKDALYDLLETREVLETSVVQFAIKRANEQDIDELEKTIDWMIEKPDQAAEADIVFHITLARISQNQVMLNIIKSLEEIMNKLQEKTIYYPGRIEEIVTEHKQIVAAIRTKDEKSAERYMRLHIQKIGDILEHV